MKVADFVEPYLKTVLGHIGLTDISVFRVEGTAKAMVAKGSAYQSVKGGL